MRPIAVVVHVEQAGRGAINSGSRKEVVVLMVVVVSPGLVAGPHSRVNEHDSTSAWVVGVLAG